MARLARSTRLTHLARSTRIIKRVFERAEPNINFSSSARKTNRALILVRARARARELSSSSRFKRARARVAR